MLFQRLGDHGVFAIGLRVKSRHDALQLREFSDHVRHEIGFAQVGHAFGFFEFGKSTHRAGENIEQFFHAFFFIEKMAQLFLEHDTLERVHLSGKRGASVLIKKESRVRQSSREHALIAFANDLLMHRHPIADTDKMRQELCRSQRLLFSRENIFGDAPGT